MFALSDSKNVTLYELATGAPICRSGFVATTGTIRFAQISDFLFTSSAPLKGQRGIISVWKIPENISNALKGKESQFPVQTKGTLSEALSKDVIEEESITDD